MVAGSAIVAASPVIQSTRHVYGSDRQPRRVNGYDRQSCYDLRLQSSIVTQGRFTQPMVLPGQYFPQPLQYLPPLLIPYSNGLGSQTPDPQLNSNIAIPPTQPRPQYCIKPIANAVPQTGINMSSGAEAGLASQCAELLWNHSYMGQPVSNVDVVGALQCQINLNSLPAKCILDIGSGIFFGVANFCDSTQNIQRYCGRAH